MSFLSQLEAFNGMEKETSNSYGLKHCEAPERGAAIMLPGGIEITALHINNGSNISDEILGQVFRRIVREESAYKLFYDGSVRNTTDFIRFMRNGENEIFFVRYKGKEAGFFWLNSFRQKSFFINYCFYKEFLGDAALTISSACIDFIFSRKDAYGAPLVEVLLGLTPANNKLAIKFLLKNGMTILGKVPGFLYDAIEDITVDGIFSYRQRQKNKRGGFTMASLFFAN